MKRKKAIKHRIIQRAADRKNSRRIIRHWFRLKAKATQLQTVKEAVEQTKKEE